MLSVIFILVFVGLFFLLQNRLLSLLLQGTLLFYFIAYDLREKEFVLKLFEFAQVTDYQTYLVLGFSTWVSVLIVLIVDQILSGGHSLKIPISVDYNQGTLRKVYYFFSLLSIAGTIVNFSHVGYSFNLLLVSPRQYELTFGSSTLMNYLYFLNIPALCLYIYLRNKQNAKVPAAKLINVVLVTISVFHGVKFTVFDTVLIPLFFFYYSTDRPINYGRLILILTLLILFYLGFSTYIRGGEDSPVEQILSYILPNYYNLAYSLETTPFQWDGLNIIMPDKIPGFFDPFYKYGPGGFMLNEKYNMQTAYISYYRFGWMFGPMIFLLIITYVRRLYKFRFRRSLVSSFVLAYIDYCLLFAFFFHAFTKTKYVYYIFIFVVLHLVTKSRRIKGGVPSVI